MRSFLFNAGFKPNICEAIWLKYGNQGPCILGRFAQRKFAKFRSITQDLLNVFLALKMSPTVNQMSRVMHGVAQDPQLSPLVFGIERIRRGILRKLFVNLS